MSEKFLRSWPLPSPDDGHDKDARGRVLIVAGSKGMPGAAILSATASLRAGAGKLQIASPASVAPWIALAVVEALVTELPESPTGSVGRRAVAAIRETLATVDAVLVGPGMTGKSELKKFLKAFFVADCEGSFVVDAEALKFFGPTTKLRPGLRGRVILTPHAGEMADILHISKTAVEANPEKFAADYARISGAVVVLKGADSFIASPLGDLYHSRAGNCGLAISGSGDTLSGIIAGLVARKCPPVRAAVWGVHLHAKAGERLAKRIGKIGYLPRELLLEVPKIMSGIA